MIKQRILYCQPVLERFKALIENSRLAHAYLFVGPACVGKRETAEAIAKLVNCAASNNETFCDSCPSCIKINNLQHPDVYLIDAEASGSIKIDEIRSIIKRVSLKPFEGKRKVFIIVNAENLTSQAANALLKTLEEPPNNSLIILTTCFPQRNLDTIKSRCHIINFYSVSFEKLDAQLCNDFHISKDVSHFLASYAEGCPGKALKLNEEKLFQRKNDILNRFVFDRSCEPYLKKLASDKEQLKESLDVLLSWFRDLVLIKAGADNPRLIHQDRKKDLLNIKSKYSSDKLQGIINEITATAQQLDDNFNMKVALALLKERVCLV